MRGVVCVCWAVGGVVALTTQFPSTITKEEELGGKGEQDEQEATGNSAYYLNDVTMSVPPQ